MATIIASATKPTAAESAKPTSVLHACFSGGDRDGYASVFRRDGGILSNDGNSKAYMQAHEAQVWNSVLRAQRMKVETWKEEESGRSSAKRLGIDQAHVGTKAVTSEQTPASQLNFRILGARLS